jgi:hypothetical protein
MARRKGHDPSQLTAEEQKAQQVAIAQEYIEIVGQTQRRIGDYYNIPQGFENWHIVRCGDRDTAAAMAMAQRLERMGYKRAPRGIMCRGFEEYDGQDGIYVWAPPEVRMMHEERKRLANIAIQKNLSESFAGTLGSLQSIKGNVTTASATSSSPGEALKQAKAGLK